MYILLSFCVNKFIFKWWFFFFTPYSGVSVECAVSNFRVSEFIDVEVNGWNKIFLSALDMFEGILASHIYIRGNSHDVEFHN